MTLTLTSAWASTAFDRTEGQEDLVVTIEARSAAPPHRVPVDIAFALDRSGSMQPSDKLEVVKDAVIASLAHLEETDRVALVTFDHEVQLEHRLTPMDPPHRKRLERVTRLINAGGSTNLHGGWWEACNQLASSGENATKVRRAILLTDGQANAGITQPNELTGFATELRRRGISTSAIGVGYGFDEILLSAITEAGGGNFQFIEHTSQLEAFFAHELASLTSTVARAPFLDITFPAGVSATLLNAFPHQQHPHGVSVDVRDLAAGEKVHLVFEVKARFLREQELTPQIHAHWTNPTTNATEELDVAASAITVGAHGEPVEAVALIAALERSARDQREAVLLDRAGRFQESRSRSAQAYARMQAMPATAEVVAEREALQGMMQMDAAAPMPEDMRKHGIHRAHARSRGRANSGA